MRSSVLRRLHLERRDAAPLALRHEAHDALAGDERLAVPVDASPQRHLAATEGEQLVRLLPGQQARLAVLDLPRSSISSLTHVLAGRTLRFGSVSAM
jgi:hypothetical protein